MADCGNHDTDVIIIRKNLKILFFQLAGRSFLCFLGLSPVSPPIKHRTQQKFGQTVTKKPPTSYSAYRTHDNQNDNAIITIPMCDCAGVVGMHITLFGRRIFAQDRHNDTICAYVHCGRYQ
jgi:hypothetical protein